MVSLLACTKPSDVAEEESNDVDEQTAEESPQEGGEPEEEGEEEYSTEHYMRVRSEVMVELYTTDEEGVRQFLPWGSHGNRSPSHVLQTLHHFWR